MEIRYRDLSVTDFALRARLLDSIDKVLQHGRFILGPEHTDFEERMAAYCGRQHGIGVNSGTDALFLALKAAGIGEGDEVITTPLSWIATANAIVLAGAEPVFADIREDLNIDPARIEALITDRTRAIIPVHFTGQMCEMETIMEIAARHDLIVIEDGAQAFGAKRNDRICGSYGTMSCFSMNPMKVYNGYGEAGAIVTDDADIREKLTILRYGGTINKQDCVYPSLNGRLDTIQAAMLVISLDYLEEKIEKRREIAALYNDRLDNVVRCPRALPGNKHIYYAYSVLADDRDALMSHLAERGVETQVQHPIPMPRHTAYRDRFDVDIPVAERAANEILCLPNQEDLVGEREVDYVTGCIREFYGL